jgi:peptidoglycan/xylan/chitin deacetylase (PgdA/CDA1 family)
MSSLPVKLSFRDRAAAALTRLPLRGGLKLLGAWPGVLVLNYHRIGNREGQPWDRTMLNANADELDSQLATLARHAEVIGPDEVFAAMSAGRGRRVLITFDDGYRDNYELAFPLLRRHGLPATFFLASGFLDSPRPAWWDEIAWMVRHARDQTRSTEAMPSGGRSMPSGDGSMPSGDGSMPSGGRSKPSGDGSMPSGGGSMPSGGRSKPSGDGSFAATSLLLGGISFPASDEDAAIAAVIARYKTLPDGDGERLLDELAAATGSGRCGASEVKDLWMTWEMAREMHAAGMSIGGHTVTHPVLARLTPESQREEVTTCARRLHEELGVAMRWFAYPVGNPDTFTSVTREILRECGVELAFSFYGGFALPSRWDPLDVPRIHVGPVLSPQMLRAMFSRPRLFAR